MGISVSFLGICTHVWWEGMQPRVVLVNATEEKSIAGQPVGSHLPTLRIAAKDIKDINSMAWPGTSDAIVEWRLDGARISIGNGKTPARRDPERFHCIPSLRELLAPESEIGPPSMPAVDGEDARLASCIFDITCGTISGGALQQNGAVFSMLRTETEGLPELQIAAFGSGNPTVITLLDGAEITISNLGATARQDGPFDFYLHYTLAAQLPGTLKVPAATGEGCVVNAHSPTWPPGFNSVDVGCSNSQYP